MLVLTIMGLIVIVKMLPVAVAIVTPLINTTNLSVPAVFIVCPVARVRLVTIVLKALL